MKNSEVMQQIKAGKFPDELTFNQFDSMPWKSKQFGLDDDRPLNEIAKDVLDYAKKTDGQIYTQVDGDKYRMYSKGMCFVNRTGIWEVITGESLEVDNS